MYTAKTILPDSKAVHRGDTASGGMDKSRYEETRTYLFRTTEQIRKIGQCLRMKNCPIFVTCTFLHGQRSKCADLPELLRKCSTKSMKYWIIQ